MSIKIATMLSHFTQYQHITTVDARRDFLQERTNVLRKEEFTNISPYWQGIGKELAELWAKRLEEEIQQARDWLRLDIRLTQEDLPLGIQTIHFTINNPTRSLAQKLRLTVEDSEGVEWHHREVKRGLLEGGYEAQLGLELETRQVGSIRIAGRLEAEDIANNVITVPFVFQVRVAEAGKPYQIPPYQLMLRMTPELGWNKPVPAGVSGEVRRTCPADAIAGNARKRAYSGLRCVTSVRKYGVLTVPAHLHGSHGNRAQRHLLIKKRRFLPILLQTQQIQQRKKVFGSRHRSLGNFPQPFIVDDGIMVAG